MKNILFTHALVFVGLCHALQAHAGEVPIEQCPQTLLLKMFPRVCVSRNHMKRASFRHVRIWAAAIMLIPLLIFFDAASGRLENAIVGNQMDLQKICQLTIDLKTLDEYFHIEELPERKPLLILKNEYIESKPSLIKFGESVQYVSRNALKNEPRPYLEFSKIEVGENTAHVEFLYPPEGIAGRVKFFKNALGWHIEAHHLAER